MPNGFELTTSLVNLHRTLRVDPETAQFLRGTPPPSARSLVPGAFLTAFANGEAHLRAASKARSLLSPDSGRPLHLGSRGVVAAYANVGMCLAGRARVAPRKTGIWKWTLLEGDELQSYLFDAYEVRNRIAHFGSPAGAAVRSTWFTGSDGRRANVTLMTAEGLLQVAQDLAYLVATRPEQEKWRWCLPDRTATGRMPRNLAKDPRFPLPDD